MQLQIKQKHGILMTEEVSGVLSDAQDRCKEIYSEGKFWYDTGLSGYVYWAPRQISYVKITE